MRVFAGIAGIIAEGTDTGYTTAWIDLDRQPRAWAIFRKKVHTHATRIEGPFRVETSEGPLDCADGWLAVDARGYPYPIAADEFALIYEEVE